MRIKFKNWDCELVFTSYASGQTGIILKDPETDATICVATVALGSEIPKNHVLIKDYSEDEGMLDCLMEAGIVSEPVCYHASGYVLIPECKLLVSVENGK